MAYKNKEDQARYHREVWYPRNKARRVELNRAWKAKQRQLFQDYKSQLFCEVCGESTTVCLDFHHVDPSTKLHTVAELGNQGARWDRVKAEIDKCAVVCANCHRKIHAGIVQLGRTEAL